MPIVWQPSKRIKCLGGLGPSQALFSGTYISQTFDKITTFTAVNACFSVKVLLDKLQLKKAVKKGLNFAKKYHISMVPRNCKSQKQAQMEFAE